MAPPAFIELHAFCFQHPLLLIVRDNDSAGRARALSVDYAMPWCVVTRAMHDKSYSSSCVALAENLGDLSICHDSPARDLANDFINALAVVLIGIHAAKLNSCSQDYTRWSSIAGPTCEFQWQADKLEHSCTDLTQIQSFQNHDALRQKREVCLMGS